MQDVPLPVIYITVLPRHVSHTLPHYTHTHTHTAASFSMASQHQRQLQARRRRLFANTNFASKSEILTSLSQQEHRTTCTCT